MLTEAQIKRLEEEYYDDITMSAFQPFRYAFRQLDPKKTFFFGLITLDDIATKRRNPYSNQRMCLHSLRVDSQYFLRLLEAKRDFPLKTLRADDVSSRDPDFKTLITMAGVSDAELKKHRTQLPEVIYAAAAYRPVMQKIKKNNARVTQSRWVLRQTKYLAMIYIPLAIWMRHLFFNYQNQLDFLNLLNQSQSICNYLQGAHTSVPDALSTACPQSDFYMHDNNLHQGLWPMLGNLFFNLPNLLLTSSLLFTLAFSSVRLIGMEQPRLDDLLFKGTSFLLNLLGSLGLSDRFYFAMLRFSDAKFAKLSMCQTYCNKKLTGELYSEFGLGSLFINQPKPLSFIMVLSALTLSTMVYLRRSFQNEAKKGGLVSLGKAIDKVKLDVLAKRPDSSLLFFEPEPESSEGIETELSGTLT